MSDGTVLVAIIAFLGVVLSPVIVGFINGVQQKELERHRYIDKNVESLRKLRGELQYCQLAMFDLQDIIYDATLNEKERHSKAKELMHLEIYERMEIAFGNAYALMLSVDVEDIRKRAPDVIAEKSGLQKKLEAINYALGRLGNEYDFIKKSSFDH
jgi:hypothetical protein